MSKGKRKEKIEKELERIVAVLASEYKPQKIILFGSLAKGIKKTSQDIDLFLVKDTSTKFYLRGLEARKILGNSTPFLPLDIIIYTPNEFERAKKENRFFLEKVLETGKVLYEAQKV